MGTAGLLAEPMDSSPIRTKIQFSPQMLFLLLLVPTTAYTTVEMLSI